MVDLNPIKGHEEGNYRPVLVINRDDIVVPGDVKIVLPITTHGGTFKTKTPLDILLIRRTLGQSNLNNNIKRVEIFSLLFFVLIINFYIVQLNVAICV